MTTSQTATATVTAPWFSSPAIALPASALADPSLKIRAKLILVSIASLAGADGSTAPLTKGAIAAACGLPATNLARELRELVAAGWLEVSRQPGASNVYQLHEPQVQPQSRNKPKVVAEAVAAQHAMPDFAPLRPLQPGTDLIPLSKLRSRVSSAQVTTSQATVSKVEKHDNSWLVSFAFEDDSAVSTIFLGAAKPCEIGDTATVDVRTWQGRRSIAGGAACGVRWIDHHPAPRAEFKVVDLVVSELNRYATPAGRVYVSLLGQSDQWHAKASLPETNVPKGIDVGSLIRISRRDGGLITPEFAGADCATGMMPHLEIAGEGYVVQPVLPEAFA